MKPVSAHAAAIPVAALLLMVSCGQNGTTGNGSGGEGGVSSTAGRPITVVYPPADALIAATDSNFIFGSVADPEGALSINGAPVTLHPSGTFLAWIPVPQGDTAIYELVLRAGSDSTVLRHPVRVPARRRELPLDGRLVVDSSSAYPRQPLLLRADEQVRVVVRAPANASVYVEAGRTRVGLVNGAVSADSVFIPDVSDSLDAARLSGDSTRWATQVSADFLRRGGTIVVGRGRDVVRLALPPVAILEGTKARFGLLQPFVASVPDSDRYVIARPSPGGTYKWMLLPGTFVEVTGRDGDFARVRLDSALEVWVPAVDVLLMPAGFVPPRPVPGNARLESSEEWVDLILPMGERAPYFVETGGNKIDLLLYGVRANLDNIAMPATDSLVRIVSTIQESSDRARISLQLSEPHLGYAVLWQDGAMVLRVRRMPAISRRSSLRGLVIVVDAGHPPAGATGPSGMHESVPTLAIAQRLERILRSRGATVVMTRSDATPLDLAARPVIARRANAHAMVSIHLNALPDGVNPFTSNGTSTYYFQPSSEPLARSVQVQMLRRLGLPDLGVMYNTFAVTRPTWMPTILCEGAFLMIPEQEAAIKTATFQNAYATAVADGLQTYFASLAR